MKAATVKKMMESGYRVKVYFICYRHDVILIFVLNVIGSYNRDALVP